MNPGEQSPRNLMDILRELTSPETQERLPPDMLIGILSLLNLLGILSRLAPHGTPLEFKGINAEGKQPPGPDLKGLADLVGNLAGKSGETQNIASLINLLGPQLSKMAPVVLPLLMSMLNSQGKPGPSMDTQGQEINPPNAGGRPDEGSQNGSKGGAKE